MIVFEQWACPGDWLIKKQRHAAYVLVAAKPIMAGLDTVMR